MKINALIYDGGLGGEFIFKTLIESSNLINKNKYGSSYWNINSVGKQCNKWSCEDAFAMLFHITKTSKLCQQYFNLHTDEVVYLNSDELLKLMSFGVKIWYNEIRDHIFSIDHKQLIRAIDRLPEVSISEPLFTKGHYLPLNIPKEYDIKSVNLSWEESKKSILENIYTGKVANLKYVFADKSQTGLTGEYIDMPTYNFVKEKYYIDETNKLILNSYYLIIEPEKEQWNILADFFDIKCNFNWSNIEQNAQLNKKLYDV
jgi:hypothetical protein